LATPKSDYDTFTFVLPTLQSIATLAEPVSTKIEDEYGHINIKDIRLGLKLLRKTSPNSVECFSSKYRYIEPEFESYINMITPIMLRCDTHHMMTAIGGLAHQLIKRNMPAGKRFSHILRMECMVPNYFNIHSDILSMPNPTRQLAMEARLDPDNPIWDTECERHEARVQELIASSNVHQFDDTADFANKSIIDLAERVVNYVVGKVTL
jgi:hypothetical protein